MLSPRHAVVLLVVVAAVVTLQGRHLLANRPRAPKSIRERVVAGSYGRQRHEMYVKATAHGGAPQGDPLFDKDAKPVLRKAVPPVHAVVAKVEGIDSLLEVVRKWVRRRGWWMQKAGTYHTTLHHFAAPPEQAVLDALGATCPFELVLERVVLTSGGVVIACWQHPPGVPPPQKLLNSSSLFLHTTLARAARPGLALPPGAATTALQGLKVVVRTLWYVIEYHRLALALDGNYSLTPIPLACSQRPSR